VIFLANPGVLILPNFYQEKTDKATHGYSDEYKEEKGFYIFKEKNINRKRKDIQVKDIFDIIISNSGF
jgi:hypothetical protein